MGDKLHCQKGNSLENHEGCLEATIIERVRNSSLVK
jgi:hypothetical protein